MYFCILSYMFSTLVLSRSAVTSYIENELSLIKNLLRVDTTQLFTPT